MIFPIPENPTEKQSEVIKLLHLHPKTIKVEFEVLPDKKNVLMRTTVMLNESEIDKVLEIMK